MNTIKNMDNKTKIILGVFILLVVGIIVYKYVSTHQRDPEDINQMNKQELIAEVNKYKSLYIGALDDVSSIKQVLNGIEYMDDSTTITAIDLENDEFKFNSYDSKMIFPDTFKYPDSVELSNTTEINLASNVTMKCDSNWIVQLGSSSVTLQHSSGISGLIKMQSIANVYDRDKLQSTYLEPWFEKCTNNKITYSNIFLNNTKWGVQAQSNITLDNDDAYLRAGMVGFGNYSMTYVFVYRGEQDTIKDESIKALLNSINFLGQGLTVE